MNRDDKPAPTPAARRAARPLLRLTFPAAEEAAYREALRRSHRSARVGLFLVATLGFGLAPLYQAALFAPPPALLPQLAAIELAVAAAALAATAVSFFAAPRALTAFTQGAAIFAIFAGVGSLRYFALQTGMSYPTSMIGVVMIAVAIFGGFSWQRIAPLCIAFAAATIGYEFWAAAEAARPAPQAFAISFLAMIAVLGSYTQEVLSRWRWRHLQRLRAAAVALQESEARFEAFMEHTPAIAWIKDEQGRYVTANRALRERYTAPGQDWVGRTDRDFFPAAHAAASTASDRQVLAAGQLAQSEVSTLDRHGKPAVWWVQKFPLRDHAGRRYVGGFGVDLTERKRLERELRESESRFQAFLDHNPAISWMKDEEGRYLYVSASYRRFLGARGDDWRGRTDFELFPREFAEKCREIESRVLGTGQPHTAEGPLADHKGRQVHWLLVRFPFASSSGKRFIGGVATDITPRKRVQEALAERERHLRTVQDAAPIGMVTLGRDGRFLSVNTAFAAMSGYSVDELLKLRLDQLAPERERPEAIASVQHQFESAGSAAQREGHLLHKDGRETPVHLSTTPLRDEQGHVRCLISTVQDLTARRQAERALRESEQRYRFMTESSPDQVWTASPDGKLDYVNEAAARFSGWSTEHLLRSGWMGMVHPDDVDRVVERFQNSIKTGASFEHEYRLKRSDGEYRWCLTRAHLLRDEQGQPVKWFGTTVDIEDLKRARQQAEAATQAKAAFLANMSHEIRTPMNAVVGMTSILLDSPQNAEQREWTEVIRNSGEHLLTVINDILDFSKIEAGGIELESQPFSLSGCLDSALDLVAVNARNKSIAITRCVQGGVPDGVRGDVGRLRQVLLNLLSNAIKFTPGGGTVAIDVDSRADGALHEIRFAVRDSGPGLSAAQQERLFKPFSQADVSTTRTHGGTGLGLSISKRLIELMGGRIGVESEPGRGATFHFTIRVPAAALDRQTADARTGLVNDLGREHPLRILVAEDNAVNQKVAKLLLNRMGYQPDFVADGAEALAAVQRQPYDVVFMDVQMPNMDGITASRELCRNYAPGARPRIIGMTANAMMEDKREAEAAGMEDYIIKPVTAATVAAALKRCQRR